MKTVMKHFYLAMILTVAAATLTGCADLFGSDDSSGGGSPGDQVGTVEISVGGQLGASTLVPDFSQIVDSYTVTLSRDGHDDLTETRSVPLSDPVAFSAVAVGEWSVTVDAVDSDGGNTIVGSGTASVTVAAGAVNSVTVDVVPLTGESGDIDISITWPSSDSLSLGSFSLTSADDSDASSAVSDNSITDGVQLSSSGGLSSGSYTLTVVLQRGTLDVATVIEAVQVYDNVTTTATISLDATEIGDAPPAPSGLAATEVTSGVELTWTDNATTELTFEVERSVGGGSFAALSEVSANVTSYTDTDVSPATSYEYRVRGTNSFGDSDWTTVSITTLSDEAALSQISLDGTALSGFSSETYSYTVTRAVGTTSIEVAATPVDTNATVSGTGEGLSVVPGQTQIDITVTAENGVTTVTYTVTVETPPAAPSGLTASDGTTSTGIVLDWNDVTGADGYDVYRRAVNGTFGSTPIATPSTSTYTDSSSGAASGDIYEYRVVALADGIESSVSGIETGYAGNEASISIIFDQPEDPAIITGVPSSSVTQGTDVTVTIDGSYTGATWYLNGTTGAAAFTTADTSGATIDTTNLAGDNTVSVVVSDGTNLYSGQFSFTVEN